MNEPEYMCIFFSFSIWLILYVESDIHTLCIACLVLGHWYSSFSLFSMFSLTCKIQINTVVGSLTNGI